ncbi:AAA family ATPase [Pseudonocardia sp.]|uniref:ATP-binding protein n=1 Tax=Pseudonocardia sp. TaxID=60912 RepID=UPI003D13CDBA
MRIAFVGKGGSGKTTVAALFSRHLAERGLPVLAVDADVDQHLAQALGDETAPPPALGADAAWLKEHLRGANPRIPSPDAMIKTTPPGRGSRLVSLDPDDAVLRRCARSAGGVRYLVAGAFDEADIGVSCYHSKTGAVELWLNHLVDGPREYVVVDMTAGADAFASGLFTRFDLTVLVSEPTRRGVGVYRQYAGYAQGHGVALRVLGNKVENADDGDDADDADDVAYLRSEVGDALVGWLRRSAWVRAAERGSARPVAELEPENLAVLDTLLALLDARERDWAAYQRGTVEFHRRNALAWANRAAGADLTAQIDPGFVPGPTLQGV